MEIFIFDSSDYETFEHCDLSCVILKISTRMQHRLHGHILCAFAGSCEHG